MSGTPPWLAGRRIAYVPYSEDHSAPGDRRRFAYWAQRRGVRLERPRPAERYDLVVLSGRADITTWSRAPRDGTALVFELIDSYLAVPRSPGDLARGTGKWLLRQHARFTPSYRDAVQAMCGRADIVICSTPEQQAVLQEHAADVRPILDVHEEVGTPPPRPAPEPGVVRLLWEGLPENIRGFHGPFDSALGELRRTRQVELHLVTDMTARRWLGRLGTLQTRTLVEGLAVRPVLHPWSPATLREAAARCDLGVIPIDLTNPLAAAKPENKLALMWRLGLPVLASATPAYRRCLQAAGEDLTCRSAADWVRGITTLQDDGDARARAANQGAAYVRTHHTPAALLAKWDQLVQDALR